MTADALPASRFHDILEEGQVYGVAVEIIRPASYYRETYGTGTDGELVLISDPDSPVLTVYEGDTIDLYVGIYDKTTGRMVSMNRGVDEDGYLRLSGLAVDDVRDGDDAPYSFWTETTNAGGVWTTTFGDDFHANEGSLNGMRLELGGPSEFLYDAEADDGAFVYNNGNATDVVQTLSIEGWIDNPYHDFSTGEDGDLLVGTRMPATLNYVDLADVTIEDIVGETATPEPEPEPEPEPGHGTPGRDRMIGTRGIDQFHAEGGNDVLKGRGGHDLLDGGGGRDVLKGGGGGDLMYGGRGADRLFGGRGADVMDGQGGRDKLVGGGGSDQLTGGNGRDVLKGGGGADIFAFDDRDGRDRILDYAAGQDVMVITGAPERFEDLTLTDSRAGARIHWEHSTVLLIGVDAQELTVFDFEFL